MKVSIVIFASLLVIYVVCVTGCKEKEFVPKMRGYHLIELPDHQYQKLVSNHPYEFEYSKYATIEVDTTGLYEPHWINLNYKDFGATVQLTYKDLNNSKLRYAEMVDDAIKLANKHQVKAYSIEEVQVKSPEGKTFFVYELAGDVPSQFQFYATDTTKHFLRGALYFKTATRNDSLSPVIEYIKIDVIQALNTLKWK